MKVKKLRRYFLLFMFVLIGLLSILFYHWNTVNEINDIEETGKFPILDDYYGYRISEKERQDRAIRMP